MKPTVTTDTNNNPSPYARPTDLKQRGQAARERTRARIAEREKNRPRKPFKLTAPRFTVGELCLKIATRWQKSATYILYNEGINRLEYIVLDSITRITSLKRDAEPGFQSLFTRKKSPTLKESLRLFSHQAGTSPLYVTHLDIANYLNISKSSVTRACQTLIHKGFFSSMPLPSDAKQSDLKVTPRGRLALRAARYKLEELDKLMFDHLGQRADDLADLLKFAVGYNTVPANPKLPTN